MSPLFEVGDVMSFVTPLLGEHLILYIYYFTKFTKFTTLVTIYLYLLTVL